ncbi:MAG: hypothetical protein ACON5A_02510 [Candidatus Comchoanobacterales bacterium]
MMTSKQDTSAYSTNDKHNNNPGLFQKLFDILFSPFDLLIRFAILIFQYSGLQWLFFKLKTGQNTKFIYQTLDTLEPEKKNKVLYHLRILLFAQVIYTAILLIEKTNMRTMYDALANKNIITFTFSIKTYLIIILISQLIRAFLRYFRRNNYANWHRYHTKKTLDFCYNTKPLKATQNIDNSESILSTDLPDSIDYATVTTMHFLFTTLNCIVNTWILTSVSLNLFAFLLIYVTFTYFWLRSLADQKSKIFNVYDTQQRDVTSEGTIQKADTQIILRKANENSQNYYKTKLWNKILAANESYQKGKIVVDTEFSIWSKTLNKIIVPILAIVLCGDLMSGKIGFGAFMLSIKTFMDLSGDLLLMVNNINMYVKFDNATARVKELFEAIGFYKNGEFIESEQTQITSHSLNNEAAYAVEIEEMNFSRLNTTGVNTTFFYRFSNNIEKGQKIQIRSKENGVGKSTFFDLLLGVEQPDNLESIRIKRSQVCYVGAKVSGDFEVKLNNIKTMIKNDPNLDIFNYQECKNIFYPNLYETDKEVDSNLIKKFIQMYMLIIKNEDISIDDINNVTATSIFENINSSGEQQAAYFCVNYIAATATNRSILLLDECFSNMGPEPKERIAEIINKNSDLTVLHIRHSDSNINYNAEWEKRTAAGFEITQTSIPMTV